jgi:xanthine dehydrogenase accessory factor
MVREGRPVCLATLISATARPDNPGAGLPDIGAKLLIPTDGSAALGSIHPEIDRAIASDATRLLAEERSQALTYEVAGGTLEVFVECFPPPPHLVIVGAVHIAITLCKLAKLLGYRVTIIDPREAFATQARFPEADRIMVEWPEEAMQAIDLNMSTYVVVLTHDPKLDLPALMAALSSPVRYVGAIGSRKTSAERRASLAAMGATDEQIARLHSPVGLAIGARSPAEIAVSIMAEIIAVRRL